MFGVAVIVGLLGAAGACFWGAYRRALARAQLAGRSQAHGERAVAERAERTRLDRDLAALDAQGAEAEAHAADQLEERLAREPSPAEVDSTLDRIEARRRGPRS